MMRRKKSIFLIVCLLLAATLALGFLNLAQYRQRADRSVSATLNGTIVSGVRGGYQRKMALTQAREPWQDPVLLARHAPVWTVGRGSALHLYLDGRAASRLQAEAIDHDGNVTELPTSGNEVSLPDARGSYVISVRAYRGEDWSQYALRVFVKQSTQGAVGDA